MRPYSITSACSEFGSIRLLTYKARTAMTALTLAIPDSALSALRRSPAEFGREMKLAAAIHWYGRGLM